MLMGDFNLPDINWDNIDVISYYTERSRGGRGIRQTSSEKLIELFQNSFLMMEYVYNHLTIPCFKYTSKSFEFSDGILQKIETLKTTLGNYFNRKMVLLWVHH